MKTSSTFSTLACVILIGAAVSPVGRAETIFTQDFENGLGANESVFGRFSINDTLTTLNNGTLMMGHDVAYGPLGGGASILPSYSYYELALDLRGHEGATLTFELTGGVEKDFDGFNIQATAALPLDLPNDLLMPEPASGLQYGAITIHGASSPELGPTAWFSSVGSAVESVEALYNLSDFDGQKVHLRFQFGTDTLEGGEGVNFDNIVVEGTALPDTDNDGMPDPYEDDNGLDKDVDDRLGDLDGDGLDNITEFNNCTDPNSDDTDGDGVTDGDEINGDPATNPIVADTDGDGLDDGQEAGLGTDPTKIDTDSDDFSDSMEVNLGSNPLDSNSTPDVLLGYWNFNDPAAPGLDVIGNVPEAEVRDPATPTNDGEGFSGAAGDYGLDFGAYNDGATVQTPPGSHFDLIPELNTYTVVLWQLNRTPLTNSSTFWFDAPQSSGGARGIQAHIPWGNGTIYFDQSGCCAAPTERLTIGSGVMQDEWQHYAFRRDEDDNRDIFVDGVSVTQSTGAAPLEPFSGIVNIGSANNGGNSLNGIVDEFAVWARALSDEEIEALYNGRQEGLSIEDIYLGGGSGDSLKLEVRRTAAGMLELSWDSASGQLFNVRSETDPSNGAPVTWPIYDGNENIEATPERNVLLLDFPAEAERYFAIESFPAPPEVIMGDDFESGAEGWTMGSDGAAGTAWELGTPSAVGPAAAHSPANCFGTNLDSNYADDAEVWLRSPAIDLTTAGAATLTYFQWTDIEVDFDVGEVRVLDASDNSELAVLDDSVDGATTDWEEVRHSIPGGALGKTIVVEFRLLADDFQSLPGWYIDDFQVTVP